MSSRARLLWSLAGVLALAVSATFVGLGLTARSAPSSDVAVLNGESAPNYGTAPSYVLTNQNGRQVSSAQFAGKVQVVSYLFPYCTSYCPVVTRDLVVFEHRLAAAGLADKVALVAFNVDPAGAGPAQMRAFLKEFGADPADPHWQYLTGTPAQVHHVVADGFHVYYRKVGLATERAQVAREKAAGTYTPQPEQHNPLTERVRPGYDMVHNDYLEVVDAKGRIVALYDSGSTVGPRRLLAAVEDVLAGKTPPRQPVS